MSLSLTTNARPMPSQDPPDTDGTSAEEVAIGPLGFADRPQVLAIERRAFPTPWSPAMFVLELSKPSSISLAATLAGRRRAGSLVGYVVCSRYADVWHLMNVAV